MLDPDILHKLVGVAATVVVALLTVPAICYAWRTGKVFGGGFAPLSAESYEDRDGIATEESIRAYSDTRPRVAVWLGAALGLGASIAARIIVLRQAEGVHVLSDLSLWAEPACWVRPDTLPAGDAEAGQLVNPQLTCA